MQTFKLVIQSIYDQINYKKGMNFMSFFVRLLVYMHIYEYAVRKTKKKEDLEKEKRVRGDKGIKGVRDTFREIDEMTSKK